MAFNTRILVWNMGVRNNAPTPSVRMTRLAVLEHLRREKRPSIILLQEAPPDRELRRMLPGYSIETCGRLATAFANVEWVADGASVRVAQRCLAVPVQHARSAKRIWAWNIHLNSRYFTRDERRESFVHNKLRKALHACRSSPPVRTEIIAGDFNVWPHDKLIWNDDGFWANRSLEWVSSQKQGAVHPEVPLYNATWCLFGRTNAPMGTMYRSDHEGPWFVFDQILMSPEHAIPGRSQAAIVEQTAMHALCAASAVRAPNEDIGSDHLPVLGQFRVA